jgi:hypothetical protein
MEQNAEQQPAGERLLEALSAWADDAMKEPLENQFMWIVLNEKGETLHDLIQDARGLPRHKWDEDDG